jgi:hypothetical protein
MREASYKIRIRRGDFEIEVYGDREWVEKKFEQLMSKEFQVTLAKKSKIERLPETLGEFLEQKGNPQKHTELVAAFAYWLFKAEEMQSFNVKDVVECYDRTRRVKPSNANQIINTNVRNNLFAFAREKKDGYKAWILTRTGEEFVEKMK